VEQYKKRFVEEEGNDDDARVMKKTLKLPDKETIKKGTIVILRDMGKVMGKVLIIDGMGHSISLASYRNIFTNSMEISKEEIMEQYKKRFVEEEGNDDKAKSGIKKLISMDWGKDNKSQGIASEIFKGLSFNDSKLANDFMDKINKYTSSLKAEDFK